MTLNSSTPYSVSASLSLLTTEPMSKATFRPSTTGSPGLGAGSKLPSTRMWFDGKANVGGGAASGWAPAMWPSNVMGLFAMNPMKICPSFSRARPGGKTSRSTRSFKLPSTMLPYMRYRTISPMTRFEPDVPSSDVETISLLRLGLKIPTATASSAW